MIWQRCLMAAAGLTVYGLILLGQSAMLLCMFILYKFSVAVSYGPCYYNFKHKFLFYFRPRAASDSGSPVFFGLLFLSFQKLYASIPQLKRQEWLKGKGCFRTHL